jgi:hypothetical protein
MMMNMLKKKLEKQSHSQYLTKDMKDLYNET